jgi:hypothetical protein
MAGSVMQAPFVFGVFAPDALVREVLTGTERKFTEMYRACFTAGATPALKALRWLAGEGRVRASRHHALRHLM